MKISYFVEYDFEGRFNRKQIENFESEIEIKHKTAANEISGPSLKRSPIYSVSLNQEVVHNIEPYSLHKTTDFSNLRKTKYLQLSYFVEYDLRTDLMKNKLKNLNLKSKTNINQPLMKFEVIVFKNPLTIRSKFTYDVGDDFEKQFS